MPIHDSVLNIFVHKTLYYDDGFTEVQILGQTVRTVRLLLHSTAKISSQQPKMYITTNSV